MKKYESEYVGHVHKKPLTHWSSEDTVKSKTVRVDLTAPSIQAGGLPVISDGKTAYIQDDDSHVLIGAISGMKKSLCVYMPLIHILAKVTSQDENMVITDPKGELYNRQAGYLQAQGYHVYCLDFRLMNKDGYNILERIVKLYREGYEEQAIKELNDIVSILAEGQRNNCKDRFWPDCAAAYLNGTGHIMLDSYPEEDMVNICNWANFNTYDNALVLKEIVDSYSHNNSSLDSVREVLSSAENTLRSILITAASFLSVFKQNDQLAQMLSHSTFSLSDLCDKKTALFLITDDTTTTCDPIIGIIVSQIKSYLIDRAYKSESGTLERRVNFVLDEFTSYPLLDIGRTLATARSRKLRYFLCVQSLAALQERYRDYKAILANCGSVLFMGSTEREFVHLISEQCGYTTMTVDGKERPLISPAELMTLKKSWYEKECIYLNLSSAVRFCTTLPSIERYGTEVYPPPDYSHYHPEVAYYTVRRWSRDIHRRRIPRPFTEKRERQAVDEEWERLVREHLFNED